MEKQICGTCRYNRYTALYKKQQIIKGYSSIHGKICHDLEYMDGSYHCGNVDSDNCGLETNYNDSCFDWEGKK